MTKALKKLKALLWVVIITFLVNTIIQEPVFADLPFLPTPGQLVNFTPSFSPSLIRGLKVYKNDPFKFEFVMSAGDNLSASTENSFERKLYLKQEGNRLIKYFLAALTIPEKDMWVNLSPYEHSKVVPQKFGITEMGKELLAQDYLLKQVTASVMYPERSVGRQFWNKIYQEAYKKLGTTNVPVNTFNKVWIVPGEAEVYENAKDSTAVIIKSSLKVMLEEDYLALVRHSEGAQGATEGSKGYKSHAFASQVIRQIIIPRLEREVNYGRNFAVLRQVYNSLILALWYKHKLKQSLIAQGYVDRKKIQGVDVNDKNVDEEIFMQYLKSYKKGVYNYIKDEVMPDNATVPRKYFSGGVNFTGLDPAQTALGTANLKITSSPNDAMLASRILSPVNSKIFVLTAVFAAAFIAFGAASASAAPAFDSAGGQVVGHYAVHHVDHQTLEANGSRINAYEFIRGSIARASKGSIRLGWGGVKELVDLGFIKVDGKPVNLGAHLTKGRHTVSIDLEGIRKKIETQQTSSTAAGGGAAEHPAVEVKVKKDNTTIGILNSPQVRKALGLSKKEVTAEQLIASGHVTVVGVDGQEVSPDKHNNFNLIFPGQKVVVHDLRGFVQAGGPVGGPNPTIASGVGGAAGGPAATTGSAPPGGHNPPPKPAHKPLPKHTSTSAGSVSPPSYYAQQLQELGHAETVLNGQLAKDARFRSSIPVQEQMLRNQIAKYQTAQASKETDQQKIDNRPFGLIMRPQESTNIPGTPVTFTPNAVDLAYLDHQINEDKQWAATAVKSQLPANITAMFSYNSSDLSRKLLSLPGGSSINIQLNYPGSNFVNAARIAQGLVKFSSLSRFNQVTAPLYMGQFLLDLRNYVSTHPIRYQDRLYDKRDGFLSRLLQTLTIVHTPVYSHNQNNNPVVIDLYDVGLVKLVDSLFSGIDSAAGGNGMFGNPSAQSPLSAQGLIPEIKEYHKAFMYAAAMNNDPNAIFLHVYQVLDSNTRYQKNSDNSWDALEDKTTPPNPHQDYHLGVDRLMVLHLDPNTNAISGKEVGAAYTFILDAYAQSLEKQSGQHGNYLTDPLPARQPSLADLQSEQMLLLGKDNHGRVIYGALRSSVTGRILQLVTDPRMLLQMSSIEDRMGNKVYFVTTGKTVRFAPLQANPQQGETFGNIVGDYVHDQFEDFFDAWTFPRKTEAEKYNHFDLSGRPNLTRVPRGVDQLMGPIKQIFSDSPVLQAIQRQGEKVAGMVYYTDGRPPAPLADIKQGRLVNSLSLANGVGKIGENSYSVSGLSQALDGETMVVLDNNRVVGVLDPSNKAKLERIEELKKIAVITAERDSWREHYGIAFDAHMQQRSLMKRGDTAEFKPAEFAGKGVAGSTFGVKRVKITPKMLVRQDKNSHVIEIMEPGKMAMNDRRAQLTVLNEGGLEVEKRMKDGTSTIQIYTHDSKKINKYLGIYPESDLVPYALKNQLILVPVEGTSKHRFVILPEPKPSRFQELKDSPKYHSSISSMEQYNVPTLEGFDGHPFQGVTIDAQVFTAADIAKIKELGVNAVRTYYPIPIELAQRLVSETGVRTIMVGLPYNKYAYGPENLTTFWGKSIPGIDQRISLQGNNYISYLQQLQNALNGKAKVVVDLNEPNANNGYPAWVQKAPTEETFNEMFQFIDQTARTIHSQVGGGITVAVTLADRPDHPDQLGKLLQTNVDTVGLNYYRHNIGLLPGQIEAAYKASGTRKPVFFGEMGENSDVSPDNQAAQVRMDLIRAQAMGMSQFNMTLQDNPKRGAGETHWGILGKPAFHVVQGQGNSAPEKAGSLARLNEETVLVRWKSGSYDPNDKMSVEAHKNLDVDRLTMQQLNENADLIMQNAVEILQQDAKGDTIGRYVKVFGEGFEYWPKGGAMDYNLKTHALVLSKDKKEAQFVLIGQLKYPQIMEQVHQWAGNNPLQLINQDENVVGRIYLGDSVAESEVEIDESSALDAPGKIYGLQGYSLVQPGQPIGYVLKGPVIKVTDDQNRPMDVMVVERHLSNGAFERAIGIVSRSENVSPNGVDLGKGQQYVEFYPTKFENGRPVRGFAIVGSHESKNPRTIYGLGSNYEIQWDSILGVARSNYGLSLDNTVMQTLNLTGHTIQLANQFLKENNQNRWFVVDETTNKVVGTIDPIKYGATGNVSYYVFETNQGTAANKKNLTYLLRQDGDQPLTMDRLIFDAREAPQTLSETQMLTQAGVLKDKLRVSMDQIKAEIGINPETPVEFIKSAETITNNGTHIFYRIKGDPLARVVVYVSSDVESGASLLVNTQFDKQTPTQSYEVSSLGQIYYAESAGNVTSKDLKVQWKLESIPGFDANSKKLVLNQFDKFVKINRYRLIAGLENESLKDPVLTRYQPLGDPLNLDAIKEDQGNIRFMKFRAIETNAINHGLPFNVVSGEVSVQPEVQLALRDTTFVRHVKASDPADNYYEYAVNKFLRDGNEYGPGWMTIKYYYNTGKVVEEEPRSGTELSSLDELSLEVTRHNDVTGQDQLYSTFQTRVFMKDGHSYRYVQENIEKNATDGNAPLESLFQDGRLFATLKDGRINLDPYFSQGDVHGFLTRLKYHLSAAEKDSIDVTELFRIATTGYDNDGNHYDVYSLDNLVNGQDMPVYRELGHLLATGTLYGAFLGFLGMLTYAYWGKSARKFLRSFGRASDGNTSSLKNMSQVLGPEIAGKIVAVRAFSGPVPSINRRREGWQSLLDNYFKGFMEPEEISGIKKAVDSGRFGFREDFQDYSRPLDLKKIATVKDAQDLENTLKSSQSDIAAALNALNEAGISYEQQFELFKGLDLSRPSAAAWTDLYYASLNLFNVRLKGLIMAGEYAQARDLSRKIPSPEARMSFFLLDDDNKLQAQSLRRFFNESENADLTLPMLIERFVHRETQGIIDKILVKYFGGSLEDPAYKQFYKKGHIDGIVQELYTRFRLYPDIFMEALKDENTKYKIDAVTELGQPVTVSDFVIYRTLMLPVSALQDNTLGAVSLIVPLTIFMAKYLKYLRDQESDPNAVQVVGLHNRFWIDMLHINNWGKDNKPGLIKYITDPAGRQINVGLRDLMHEANMYDMFEYLNHKDINEAVTIYESMMQAVMQRANQDEAMSVRDLGDMKVLIANTDAVVDEIRGISDATVKIREFSEAGPNGNAVLSGLIKDGILENSSLTEVRLKKDFDQDKDKIQEVAGSDFDKIWDILQRLSGMKTSQNKEISIENLYRDKIKALNAPFLEKVSERRGQISPWVEKLDELNRTKMGLHRLYAFRIAPIFSRKIFEKLSGKHGVKGVSHLRDVYGIESKGTQMAVRLLEYGIIVSGIVAGILTGYVIFPFLAVGTIMLPRLFSGRVNNPSERWLWMGVFSVNAWIMGLLAHLLFGKFAVIVWSFGLFNTALLLLLLAPVTLIGVYHFTTFVKGYILYINSIATPTARKRMGLFHLLNPFSLDMVVWKRVVPLLESRGWLPQWAKAFARNHLRGFYTAHYLDLLRAEESVGYLTGNRVLIKDYVLGLYNTLYRYGLVSEAELDDQIRFLNDPRSGHYAFVVPADPKAREYIFTDMMGFAFKRPVASRFAYLTASGDHVQSHNELFSNTFERHAAYGSINAMGLKEAVEDAQKSIVKYDRKRLGNRKALQRGGMIANAFFLIHKNQQDVRSEVFLEEVKKLMKQEIDPLTQEEYNIVEAAINRAKEKKLIQEQSLLGYLARKQKSSFNNIMGLIRKTIGNDDAFNKFKQALGDVDETTDLFANFKEAIIAAGLEKNSEAISRIVELFERFLNESRPNNKGVVENMGEAQIEHHLYAASEYGDMPYHDAVLDMANNYPSLPVAYGAIGEKIKNKERLTSAEEIFYKKYKIYKETVELKYKPIFQMAQIWTTMTRVWNEQKRSIEYRMPISPLYAQAFEKNDKFELEAKDGNIIAVRFSDLTDFADAILKYRKDNYLELLEKKEEKFEFRADEFNGSLDQIDLLLVKLGQNKEQLKNIDDAVNWLNDSIEPFKNYISYINTNQTSETIRELLPANFEMFTDDEFGVFAKTKEGRKLKRLILEQLYPERTPERQKVLDSMKDVIQFAYDIKACNDYDVYIPFYDKAKDNLITNNKNGGIGTNLWASYERMSNYDAHVRGYKGQATQRLLLQSWLSREPQYVIINPAFRIWSSSDDAFTGTSLYKISQETFTNDVQNSRRNLTSFYGKGFILPAAGDSMLYSPGEDSAAFFTFQRSYPNAVSTNVPWLTWEWGRPSLLAESMIGTETRYTFNVSRFLLDPSQYEVFFKKNIGYDVKLTNLMLFLHYLLSPLVGVLLVAIPVLQGFSAFAYLSPLQTFLIESMLFMEAINIYNFMRHLRTSGSLWRAGFRTLKDILKSFPYYVAMIPSFIFGAILSPLDLFKFILSQKEGHLMQQLRQQRFMETRIFTLPGKTKIQRQQLHRRFMEIRGKTISGFVREFINKWKLPWGGVLGIVGIGAWSMGALTNDWIATLDTIPYLWASIAFLTGSNILDVFKDRNGKMKGYSFWAQFGKPVGLPVLAAGIIIVALSSHAPLLLSMTGIVGTKAWIFLGAGAGLSVLGSVIFFYDVITQGFWWTIREFFLLFLSIFPKKTSNPPSPTSTGGAVQPPSSPPLPGGAAQTPTGRDKAMEAISRTFDSLPDRMARRMMHSMLGKPDTAGPGGIDLTRTAVKIESSGDLIQTAFDDPSMLRLLLNSDGLTPVINDIEVMTPSMKAHFVGLN